MKKLALFAAALSLALAGCEGYPERTKGNDRWTATADTNVKIDWDKVNKAYEQAEGPEDFEKRVNEIYEGAEIVSVAVHDLDDTTQEVTGFFDKNTSGSVDEGEKIFTIRRNITGEGTAEYQTQGHGHYAGYHSPMFGLASGMLMGAMLSSALSPGYAPRYGQPYTTDTARRSQLQSQRSQYRAQNPGKYSKTKASKSGRSYGGGRRTGGGFRGGGRFGIRRSITRSPDGSRSGAPRPERLTA